MQEEKQVKNLWSNCSKLWLLIIFNKADQFLLFIFEWLVTNLKRKCLLYLLFSKSPLEIITLLSSALAQLCADYCVEIGEREKLLLCLMSHFASLWTHSRAFTWELGFTSFESLPLPPQKQQELWTLTELKPAEETLSSPSCSQHHLWQSSLGENQTTSNQTPLNGQSCSSSIRRFILQKEH